MVGSSSAARIRFASGPRMFVEGTSEYIHPASTRAKASVPCNVNTLSRSPVGRKNHAELMSAPLTATVIGASYGGWKNSLHLVTDGLLSPCPAVLCHLRDGVNTAIPPT